MRIPIEQALDSAYRLFGCVLNRNSFTSAFRGLSSAEQERIVRVAWRLRFTYLLRYEIAINANPLEQAFRFDIEHLDIPSLEIYLLFSCLDTLAGQPVHTDFGVWLPKQVTGEALTVEEVQQLYERYQDEQGVSRNLRALFYALPYALKTWVSSHVRIGRIQSKHVDWEQNEEKLLRHLFDYFYSVRRNTFTHQAVVRHTEQSNHISSKLTEDDITDPRNWFTPPSAYAYIPDRGRPHQTWILQHWRNLDEATILRMLLWGAVCSRMDLTIDQHHVNAQLNNQARLSGFYRLIGELNSNIEYLDTWSDFERLEKIKIYQYMFHFSILRMDVSASDNVGSLFDLQTPIERELAEQIQEYRRCVSYLNKEIEQFARVYTPGRPVADDSRRIAIREFITTQVHSNEYQFIVHLRERAAVRYLWSIVSNSCSEGGTTAGRESVENSV